MSDLDTQGASQAQRQTNLNAEVSSETLNLDIDGLNQAISSEIKTCLNELEARFATYPSLDKTWLSLRAFLSNKGKRVRPLLFLASYSIFSKNAESIPSSIVKAGCALEIFHSFALIHDDIIDESFSRRGEPTLHKRLHQETLKDSVNSSNLALVLGDILFGYAIECFLDVDSPQALQAQRYFLKICQDTGMGQALEIVHLEAPLSEISEEAILQNYFLKTSRYTIEGPLVLGALFAGAQESICDGLSDFATPLGLAFQIQNDLHEIDLLPHGAPQLANDIRSGVKTLFLKKFHNCLSASERLILEHCLQSGTIPNPLKQISELIQKTHVREAIKEQIENLFAQSQTNLSRAKISQKQHQAMVQLVGYLANNSHHSEAR